MRNLPTFPDLAGRHVLVTGAAGGIGGAIAGALARSGAIVIAATRTPEQSAAVAADLGHGALAVAADLSAPGAGAAIIADALTRSGGRLDGLVNVAGAQARRPALELTEEDFDLLHAVNVRATFAASQAAARHFAEHGGGAIVNITSLTAFIGVRNVAAYAATRGGAVNQLTKALAGEWAPLGIRVNAVAPGRIRTPMTSAVFDGGERQAEFERLIPMGFGGETDDVVGAVLYLLSDASRYVTGHTIVVDGGWLAAGGVTR